MDEQIVKELTDALIDGNVKRSEELAKEALGHGVPAKTLITNSIKQAADVIGEKYDCGDYFLANLVRCGDSFKTVINQIEGHLRLETGPGTGTDQDRVVIATVEGDIHDIGKNLVVTFLRGDGFAVEDLGIDISAKQVVEKAVEMEADVIALSCLMSVTRGGVTRVCEELSSRGLRDRYPVLVGGAATSEKWAKQAGCDGWAGTATDASQVARDLIARRKEA
jgi:methylmalonyl-CoA mutase cobalamin-binding domain/chain